jgi:hypothetical protein
MRELVHPNLVNYEELFLERNNTLMLVMEYMQVSSRVMKYIHADHLSGYEVHAGQPTGSWSTCRSVQGIMKYMHIIHLVVEYMQVTPQGHGVHAGQSKGHEVHTCRSFIWL